jgi:hypothetical protein
VLKTSGMILDFLIYNIILNVDVLGSITLLVVIGVIYCRLIISVYLSVFSMLSTTLSPGTNFLSHSACPVAS